MELPVRAVAKTTTLGVNYDKTFFTLQRNLVRCYAYLCLCT